MGSDLPAGLAPASTLMLESRGELVPKHTEKAPRRKSTKPGKLYPEFPLYAHPLGYWSKKIEGRIRHFGRWGTPAKAM